MVYTRAPFSLSFTPILHFLLSAISSLSALPKRSMVGGDAWDWGTHKRLATMLTVLDEDEAMFRQYALPEEVVRVRYPSREPGVWRWFRSANVVDLYRYRDGAELERIGRLLRRAAVIGNGNPNSDFLDQAFGPGRLITQCGTVRNHQAKDT